MMIETAHHAVSDGQWDEYIERHPDATLYHASAWKRIARDSYGIEDVSLTALDNGRIVGILPLFKARQISGGSYVTSGIFGAYNGVLSERDDVRSILNERAVSMCAGDARCFLVIKDTTHYPAPGFAVSQEYVTFTLALNRISDQVWAKIKDKTRNQVRKAEKSGCVVIRDNTGIDEFARVYARNMRDMGTPFLGWKFLHCVLKHFGAKANVFCIRRGVKTIAGGIMLRFKECAYMPFASSLRRYNEYCPNNLLYWEAIKFACAQGCEQFDFGRSTVNTGTYNFKKQWGAQPRQLYYRYYPAVAGTRTFNPNDKKYSMMINCWRLIPVRLASCVGPAIVRHFV